MREIVILNIALMSVAFGSLVLALWSVSSGAVFKQGTDGLFTFLVSLLFAFIFSINPILEWRRGALRDLMNSKAARWLRLRARNADSTRKEVRA